MDKAIKYFYGKGRRKTSTAQVRLYQGSGKFIINERLFNDYIKTRTLKEIVLAPFKMTGTEKIFDVSVHVEGGGFSSQGEAIRHGISKALLEFDAGFRTTLKKEGFLTRDSRMKERKKPGLKRARRAPQFSKR